jgi:protein TonB
VPEARIPWARGHEAGRRVAVSILVLALGAAGAAPAGSPARENPAAGVADGRSRRAVPTPARADRAEAPGGADAAPRARLVDAEPHGPSVEERLEEIRRRLQAALVYPPIARRLGLEGVAWVRFEVGRGGAAQGVALARSSGHAVLDRAARRTVDRAGPLPWVYGRIEVPIRFSLVGPT